ncbi:MAG: hypothetical protein AAF063_19980, partial [Cyanobacteria bacterium J06643_5]
GKCGLGGFPQEQLSKTEDAEEEGLEDYSIFNQIDFYPAVVFRRLCILDWGFNPLTGWMSTPDN